MTELDSPIAAFNQNRGERSALRQALAMLNVVDRLTLAYLTFSTALILICRANVQGWKILAPIHLGLMAMIFGLALAREKKIRVLSLISHWYPTLLFLFFFEEIGLIVHAIFPGWFDEYLIRADYALFDAHPTVWIEQFSSYWLTEYMQLVYTSYFLLTIGLGAHLWLKGKQREFAVFMASTCAAYYLNYVIFVLFPIESPHHTLKALQTAELAGGPFTAFINLLEKHGRVHGGAFPSNHVAGSVVVLISAWRFARRHAYWLTPLVLSICVATIYGRYHYVMDVLAGAVMAAVGCWIGARLTARRHRANHQS
jgi:membrane-associated phospholipid phosphatase